MRIDVRGYAAVSVEFRINQATPLLAHRVLSQGTLVFERSAVARVRFQVKTASRYLDLIPMFETHIRYLKKGVREGRIS